jgi:hypothetical protein
MPPRESRGNGESGGAKEDVMRPLRTLISAALLGAALFGGVDGTPLAQATDDDYAINGRFVATSDGAYATTDYAFHNEATVKSMWTITSKCTTDVHCTGQVHSDQGWSAPLRTEGPVWYVDHDVPHWETCPDGTSSPGHQTFTFNPSNANGVTQIGSPYLEGKDETVGPRYACGRATVLTIVMPFRLDQVG